MKSASGQNLFRRPAFAADTPCRPADEKIGVQRIIIKFPCLQATAILANFFAADRMLLGWSRLATGALECEFEIKYDDGRVISGSYFYTRNGMTRPSLMHNIRAAIAALSEGHSDGCCLHGLPPSPDAFLATYETDDFAIS